MFSGLVPIPEGCPWQYLDEEHSRFFTSELRSEIGPEHFLSSWANTLIVIARHSGSDDVIVADTDNIRNLFWVHLTWSGKIDQFPDKYPSVGRVPNSDLLGFFLEEAKNQTARGDQESLIDTVTRALEELEASDDLVICSPSSNLVAQKIVDKIEVATGLSLSRGSPTK